MWVETELDRYLVLMFNEMTLSSNFYYGSHKQRLTDFKELCSRRTSWEVKHVIVFMIRGARKQVKQCVAYYFVHIIINSIYQKIVYFSSDYRL